jgi:hypothetical protein
MRHCEKISVEKGTRHTGETRRGRGTQETERERKTTVEKRQRSRDGVVKRKTIEKRVVKE